MVWPLDSGWGRGEGGEGGRGDEPILLPCNHSLTLFGKGNEATGLTVYRICDSANSAIANKSSENSAHEQLALLLQRENSA